MAIVVIVVVLALGAHVGIGWFIWSRVRQAEASKPKAGGDSPTLSLSGARADRTPNPAREKAE